MIEFRERDLVFEAANCIVFGATCTWWDSLDKAFLNSPDGIDAEGNVVGLPRCPHCGSVLFQTSPEEWWGSVAEHDKAEPGYRAMVKWTRGKCFPNYTHARGAYAIYLERQITRLIWGLGLVLLYGSDLAA